jgi:hypothetical protein
MGPRPPIDSSILARILLIAEASQNPNLAKHHKNHSKIINNNHSLTSQIHSKICSTIHSTILKSIVHNRIFLKQSEFVLK